MEENQKNRKLVEEIQRLCNGDKAYHGPQSTPTSTKAGHSPSPITARMTRKRARESNLCSKTMACVSKEVLPAQSSHSENRSCIRTEVGDIPNCCLACCCRRKTSDSADDATETVQVSCKFQNLVECVVGLQLSTIHENDEFSISVHHPSSGCSFSLTWVNSSSGEPDLLYQLLSLGTFERVAPEWMRDILKFSPRMCPVFFERVSRRVLSNLITRMIHMPVAGNTS